MKILYYSPHPNLQLYSPSGYGTHMREMIEAFQSHGHEVKTLIMGGEEIPEEHELGIQFKDNPYKRIVKKATPPLLWQSIKDYNLLKFDQNAATTLEKAVEQFQPDMIYERGFYLMISGVKIAKKFNIKHIVEINAPYIEEKINLEGKTLLKNKAYQNEKVMVEQADQIVVVSSALKYYFEKKYPNIKEKLIVTPNAVNPKKVDESLSSSNTDKLKQELFSYHSRLEGRKMLVIGFVGSIFPYHGVDNLLYAFQSLTKKIKDQELILLIVGDGEILNELKELAVKLKIHHNVVFTGNISSSEIYKYIEVMDITVMAKSNWYGSPVKIFEYGIMEKAIIAPNNVPVKDVMVEGEDGLLIEDNIDSLTEALWKLINDPGLRLTLAANFKKKVRNYYTWKKVAKKILDSI